MRLFYRYIRQKVGLLILFAVFLFVNFCVNYVYSIETEPILYTFWICLLAWLVYTVQDFIKFYTKYAILHKHAGMEHLYVLDMPVTENVIEAEYHALVSKLINEKNELISQQEKTATEMTDYYTMWVHQIKTPISALNLLFQVMEEDNGSKEVQTKELKQELFKIEFYVDAVLQYLRLEDMSSDLKFDMFSMESIVKKSVKKFAPQFISRKIRIDIGDLDVKVLTDVKWTSFIIEQLLSNAIKYSHNGGLVRIYRKETLNINDRILVIEDQGIGISEEDLPRIFEKGFTGYNGRIGKKSTGIGLYLCRKAAQKLSHTITIASTENKGTKVFIDMTSSDIKHE